MAKNKKKVDIIYTKKTSHQHLAESHSEWDPDYWEWPYYAYWQEEIDMDYVHDEWYYDYKYDVIRLRQEKIDILLGIIGGPPTIGDVLPYSLK